MSTTPPAHGLHEVHCAFVVRGSEFSPFFPFSILHWCSLLMQEVQTALKVGHTILYRTKKSKNEINVERREKIRQNGLEKNSQFSAMQRAVSRGK